MIKSLFKRKKKEKGNFIFQIRVIAILKNKNRIISLTRKKLEQALEITVNRR